MLDVRQLPPEPSACPPEAVCVKVSDGIEVQLELESTFLGAPASGVHTVRNYAEFMPRYLQSPFVLVFESGYEDGAVVSSIGYPVAMTSDGHWAYCPDDQDPRDAELRGLGRPVVFAKRLDFSTRLDRELVDFHAYPAMPARSRKCSRGVYAEEIVPIVVHGSTIGSGN